MAVTIALDDHVAKSVERALTAAHHAAQTYPDVDVRHRDFAAHLAVALGVLSPAIVEAEGRRERDALAHIAQVSEWNTDDPAERIAYLQDVARDAMAPRTQPTRTQPTFDPHAPNAHDALDDGWGNDGE